MQRSSVLVSIVLSTLAIGVAKASPVHPDGPWYDNEQRTVIRMHPCRASPDSYCGTVAWMREPNGPNGSPFLDANNKDPSKRSRPMLGLEIFTGLAPADEGWKGTVYNPEDGKTYQVTFTVRGDEADVRGCLFGFLCKTEVFKRAPESFLASLAKKPKAVAKK